MDLRFCAFTIGDCRVARVVIPAERGVCAFRRVFRAGSGNDTPSSMSTSTFGSIGDVALEFGAVLGLV